MNMEQDRNDRDLVLHEIATAASRALTHDRKDVGSPRWSPQETASPSLLPLAPQRGEGADLRSFDERWRRAEDYGCTRRR